MISWSHGIVRSFHLLPLASDHTIAITNLLQSWTSYPVCLHVCMSACLHVCMTLRTNSHITECNRVSVEELLECKHSQCFLKVLWDWPKFFMNSLDHRIFWPPEQNLLTTWAEPSEHLSWTLWPLDPSCCPFLVCCIQVQSSLVLRVCTLTLAKQSEVEGGLTRVNPRSSGGQNIQPGIGATCLA